MLKKVKEKKKLLKKVKEKKFLWVFSVKKVLKNRQKEKKSGSLDYRCRSSGCQFFFFWFSSYFWLFFADSTEKTWKKNFVSGFFSLLKFFFWFSYHFWIFLLTLRKNVWSFIRWLTSSAFSKLKIFLPPSSTLLLKKKKKLAEEGGPLSKKK